MSGPVVSAAPTPPHSLDAEESVLGAMLLSPATVDAVSEILQPRDFYRESHGLIYQTAQRLHAQGTRVDAITITDALDAQRDPRDAKKTLLEAIGGRQRIHELAALVPATANAPHYARIVKEAAMLRGFITLGSEISRLGWERPDETSVLLERIEGMVFDMGTTRARTDLTPLHETLAGAFDRIQAAQADGRDVIGLPTGYKDIDELTNGFLPGNLVVVAARASLGKTSWALGVAHHVTVHERKPAALFTLEMSKGEVTDRLLSMDALVESQRIRTGNLGPEEWARLNASFSRLDKAPLLIEDASSLTTSEIRSRARRAKLRHPDLALVIVDYLQLVDATGENRVQEVSKVSRGLKALARELEVPVIALAQLSRQVEQRHDKRPILSDLRESGSIENDADLVFLLYREDYYYPEEATAPGIAEVNLAKQRNGPTGMRKLAFVKRYAKFGDLAKPLPGMGTVE